MRGRNWWLVALVLVAGATALVPERPTVGQPPQADGPTDKWRAWAVTEGPDTKLVVEGMYGNGGPGTVVIVEPSAPQGINPKVLMLDVKVGSLPGVWPAIAYPVPAHYTVSPYKAGTYTTIHVKYPDGNAVMIKTITDTGKGPKFQK